MKNVEVNNRSFKTIEELRGAIVRKRMDDQQAVIFVGPKATATMFEKMQDAVVIADSFWKEWPQVAAVSIDGELRSFERATDGEKMFFYELDS